ncbi:MAG: hypothetical protein Q9180_003687 [Flavoplaca navasiana]
MTPAFTTAHAGTGGSCNSGNIEKLKITFGEAVSAIQQAVQAIDHLKESRRFIISKNKKRTWNRQAQLLKALFNVDLDKPHKLAANNPGAELVRSKQNNFQAMLNGLDYGNPDVAWQYWLFCGDDWLQWRAPTDTAELDTQDPKRTLGQIYNGLGAHLAIVHTKSKIMEQYVFGAGLPQNNPVCRDRNFANTMRNARTVTFCDEALRQGTLSAAKSSINPGDALDSKLTLTHLWIHELSHLLLGFIDEEAVDVNGQRVAGVHANRWRKGVGLARWAADRARKAPDIYALFATAVYLDNYGWGTGVAENDD